MTREELSKAIEAMTTIEALTDYLLGLPETEIKTLPLGPLRKHAKKYGLDITVGEVGELLKEPIELEKKLPHFERIGSAKIIRLVWIVKRIIEAGSLSMIFGDSGTYKSFIAIAIAACIATGRDFYGHSVKKGAVYYIAAEGSAGIIRRFQAWSQENCESIGEAPLYRYTAAPNLVDSANVLIKALESNIEEETEPPALAIIDTWSRSLGGDDSDTGTAAEGLNKLDDIRAKFPGLALLLIHHTGHLEKKRPRGAYLLHAAVDSEFRVEKNKDYTIIMTNTKSKESELLSPMAFRARGVKLLAENGSYLFNEGREIETSVILEAIDYDAPTGEIGGLGKHQENVLEILRNTEGQRMEESDLLETFKKRYQTTKSTFDKTIIALEKRELVHRNVGFICLCKPKQHIAKKEESLCQ